VNSSSRTSPSPDGGPLSRAEKEKIERCKIAQEEKRFTSYLKRHHSPNAPVPTKSHRFEYLCKLQDKKVFPGSTSPEVRPRPGVSVFSERSAASQQSGKENYASAAQKQAYYSGEYSVPMTLLQI